MRFFAFFFNDPPTTEIYTLSLHDALPICAPLPGIISTQCTMVPTGILRSGSALPADRKSTRLNSSHVAISYAVFCLKKKNRRSDLRSIHRAPDHPDGISPHAVHCAGRLIT